MYGRGLIRHWMCHSYHLSLQHFCWFEDTISFPALQVCSILHRMLIFECSETRDATKCLLGKSHLLGGLALPSSMTMSFVNHGFRTHILAYTVAPATCSTLYEYLKEILKIMHNWSVGHNSVWLLDWIAWHWYTSLHENFRNHWKALQHCRL